MKRVAHIFSTSMAAGLVSLACTTEDVDVPADTTSSSSTSGSATNNASTTGQASSATSTTGQLMCSEEPCTPQTIEDALVADFSNGSPSGSTRYPESSIDTEVTDAEEWRIFGSVDTYSGFGIQFSCVMDASAYRGVRFRIRGETGSTVALSANTTSNSSPSCTEKEQHNTCSSGCSNSQGAFELTTEMQEVSLTWDDFSGGSPNARPDPRELISLIWVFGWNDSTAPYDVDVTIDDIEFIE